MRFSFCRFECAQNCRREVRDWCLSQTHTHRQIFVRYDSHHPVSHKRSVAKTLLQRAESLPSNSDSQANEREYVLNVFGENNYPKRFLNDCLRSPVCRNQNNSKGDTSVKGYAIVPYIQGVTEPIKKILSNCNIKVALKPYLTSYAHFSIIIDLILFNMNTYFYLQYWTNLYW
jgi:hypothetical protein